MKTLIFFALLLLNSLVLNAQIYWFNNFDAAKKKGKETGKLLVLDFWADWCQPCKKMDNELWTSNKSAKFSKNFVAVKIDIDSERSTPASYGVKGIPMVVIALADGTNLWDKVGFSSALEYSEVLSAIPPDVSELYTSLDLLEGHEKEADMIIKVAIEFQKLGRKVDNKSLKTAVLYEGNKYFKKALKLTEDLKQKEAIVLYQVLNDVYYGNPQKALKNFIKDFVSADNCQNKELAHFLLASCYRELKEEENFIKEAGSITDKDLLSQLNTK